MEQMGQLPKQKKSLTIIIFVVVLLFLIASVLIFWRNITQSASKQLNSWTQEFLTEHIKNSIGSEVEVSLEGFDLTTPGEAYILNINLSNKDGSVLAHLPVTKVYYRWLGFFEDGFSFDYIPRIEKIVLQRGEIFIKEDNGKLNWNSLLKSKEHTISSTDGGKPGFNGQVQLAAGKINLESPLVNTVLEEVNGEINFENPSDINISLAGKVDRTFASVKGEFRQETGELSFYIDRPIDLARFNLKQLFPGLHEVSLTGGRLENFTVLIKRDNDNNWHLNSEGEFFGIGLSSPIDISQGNGKFAADSDKIYFNNLSLMLIGQKALGQGNILWKSQESGKTAIEFSFNLPDIDSGRIVPELPAERPLVVDVTFTGSLEEPEISGSFSIPKLSFSGMPVNKVTGKFHYGNNSRLVLENINGSLAEGTISANGELFIDNGTYELDIFGKKLESTTLIDKNVQGFFEFNAHLSSRNKSPLAKGNFVIRDGNAYGVLFQSFNGFFVKKDGETNISDISVRTETGISYPEALNKDAFAKLVKS